MIKQKHHFAYAECIGNRIGTKFYTYMELVKKWEKSMKSTTGILYDKTAREYVDDGIEHGFYVPFTSVK